MKSKQMRRLEKHFQRLNLASNFKIIRPHNDCFEKLRFEVDKENHNYLYISGFEALAIEGAIFEFEKLTHHKVSTDSIEYTYSTSLLGTNTAEKDWRERRYCNRMTPVIILACKTDKGEAVICVDIPDFKDWDKAKQIMDSNEAGLKDCYFSIHFSVHSFRNGYTQVVFKLKSMIQTMKAVEKHGFKISKEGFKYQRGNANN